MCAARKFLFDTSFDDDEEDEQPLAEPEVMEEPAITAEELAAARAEGYAAGHRAGSDEERNATSRMHAEALEHLVQRIVAVDGTLEEVCERAPRQAVDIALNVARRILPDFVRREGTAEIEALIRECLRDLIDEPRLVVRVGEAAFDTVDEALKRITTRAGFAGRVVLLADENLGESDSLIEWADGGVERNVARTWREIDQTVSRILSMSRGAAPTQTTEVGGPEVRSVSEGLGTGE